MGDLGAILTAIVTPFDDELRVDEEAFVDLLRHLCAHGSDGGGGCGTTGEAPTLSDDEPLRLIELAVQERPEGATVVAGTGSNDTHHACVMTARATELGADAVLSVPPYYKKPNRRPPRACRSRRTKTSPTAAACVATSRRSRAPPTAP